MSYVKIPLSLFSQEYWTKRRPFTRGDLVLWLHTKQSFGESTRVFEGKNYKVNTGEVLVSIRFLAEVTGWSRARVERFLNEDTNEVTSEVRYDDTNKNKITVVSIRNSCYLSDSRDTIEDTDVSKTLIKRSTKRGQIHNITLNTLITESNIIDLNVADESHVDHQSSPLKNLIEDNTLSTKSKNSSKGKTKNSKQSTTLSLDLNNNNINNNSSTPLKGSTTNKDLINALDCLDDKENCDLYLTNQQVEDLIQQLGNEYFHLCYKITEWIREKNHLGGKWWRTNHYDQILKWHKNNTSTGKKFYHHPEYGMNYYPLWQVEKFQKEAV